MGGVAAKPTDLHEAFSYSKVFPTGGFWEGGRGESTPTSQKFAHPPGKVPPVYSTPNRFLFPPHEKSIPLKLHKNF